MMSKYGVSAFGFHRPAGLVFGSVAAPNRQTGSEQMNSS
jgi:hypothetical protein